MHSARDRHRPRLCLTRPPSRAGRWGHSLARGALGRGRGSRSLLHHLRSCAVAHDASYWRCLELGGAQREVARVLELL